MKASSKSCAIKDIPSLAEKVAELIKNNTFEDVIRSLYPEKMDDKTKTALLIAINYNQGKNKRDYYLEKYNLELNSYYGSELNALPEKDIIFANMEIAKNNKHFDKAWRFIVENYS